MAALQIGTGVRDITPSYPVWLHGYASRDRLSAGIRDRLSLSCLALSDGASSLLLVAMDGIGAQVEVCRELESIVQRETGIGYPAVMVASSHTHFAPALNDGSFFDPGLDPIDADPRFAADVRRKLAEAAREAMGSLRPARLEWVRRDVPHILFNRRTVRPDGGVTTNYLYPVEPDAYRFSPVDPELTVLRLVGDEGPLAALVNFGCHPVTGEGTGQDLFYHISADYPQYLRRTIAEAWACPVLFTLGAAGDAVPVNRLGDCRQRLGATLGHAAVLAQRMFRTEPDPVLAAGEVSIEADTILPTAAPRAREAYETARTRLLELSRPGAPQEALRQARQAYAERSRELARSRLYPDNRATIRVQLLRLGQTVLVGMPFEVLSEIALRLKRAHPGAVLVSCCGGYQGYLPLAHEYPRGGYEASAASTHFAAGTADRLLEAIQDSPFLASGYGSGPH